MPFELPFPPFPHDSRDVPFIATPDDNNGYAVPSSQYFKKLVGDKYLWTPVSSTDPLPVGDAAAQATLTAIQGYIDGLEAVLGTAIASPTAYTVVARLKDLATALGEVGANPTANTVLARIKTLEGYLDGVEAALGATTDAEATGNGSVIAIVKQLRKLVTDAYATFGSAAPTKGLMMAGTDGTNARAIKTNENGEVITQLSGSKAEIKDISLISTAEIAVGATEILQTTVPTGKKWTILDKTFIMDVNPNATSGTISFESRASIPLARVIASPYNKRIQFAYNAFFDGGTGQYMTGTIVPKDEAAQASLFKGLVLGNNINIDFRFTNNTDAPYPEGLGTRKVQLLVLEEAMIA